MRATGELLVGRDTQLASLRTLLDDARSGRGRAVLLLGEAGIGKTRMAEVVADLAAGEGMTVAWGRNPDAEAPPYWSWSQALGAVLGADAVALFAEGRAPGRPSLFAAAADTLELATRDRPATLILEDVHWSDASSLALLQFVVGVLPGLALLLVLTARDDPAEMDDDVAAALANLPTAVVRIPLDGLDEGATAALVQHVIGAAPPAELVSEVHDRTGGNPFFVTEVARLYVVRGERATLDVPPGVGQVLRRRLARLSQPASEVLAGAAVIGAPEVELLAAVLDRPEDDVLALVDEAVRSRLVVVTDTGFAFAHDLVRETIYGDLGPAEKAGLHRRTAEILEATPSANPADLATHWARAAGGEARARAATHAIAAARAAMARMGYEQAVRFFRWALDAGAGDRARLLVEMGEAQILAGELTAGRQTLREGAELAAAAGRAEDLARAVLAMGTGVGGFEVDVLDEHQPGLVRQALDALPETGSALRAAVLARLSLALAMRPGEGDRRVALAREAVEMARSVGDPRTEVSALAAASDALSGPDHVEERLASADRMVELALAVDDPVLLLLARRLRLVARLELGDLAGVDAEIVAYERTADRLRLPLFAWPVHIWRGMRALMDGDFTVAWRHSEEAERLGRRADSTNADMMVFTLRMAIWRAQGTPQDVLPPLYDLLPQIEQYPGGNCMVAAVFAEAGKHDEARRCVRRVLDRGLDAIQKDSEWVEFLWMLGDAALILDEHEAAQAVYDALSPYAHLWAVDGIGGACFGPVSLQLARLADHLGRPAASAAASPEPALEGELRRAGRVWHVKFRGEEATVPHSKGMSDLATLLSQPGREVHVLDLVEAAGGPTAEVAAAEGDSGPVLDARARASYKARLADLEEEIVAAEAAHDTGRAATLRAERDFVAAELAGALGLGGRARASGDRVERARKAVAMRLSTALRQVDATHPRLARHLRVSVATGRFCAYRPEQPVIWRM